MPPPIFIIGSPRSGTTLLGHVLSAHRDLAYAEEPRMVWRQGNDKRSDYLRPSDARPAVIEGIRRDFDRFVTERGKTRLLEKTPSNALRMGFLHTVYPDAMFVHVLRNGYDAALSIRSLTTRHSTGVPRGRLMQRLKEMKLRHLPHYAREAAARALPKALRGGWAVPMWGPRLPGMAQMARELDPLDLACLQWRACTEAACQYGRTLPAEQYLELRLEDLNADVFGRVLSFCGLPPDDAVQAEFAQRFRPSDPTARRAQASEPELVRIRQWTEPTMQWLGYDAALPKE